VSKLLTLNFGMGFAWPKIGTGFAIAIPVPFSLACVGILPFDEFVNNLAQLVKINFIDLFL
jgi:hypothetical protein